VTAQTLFFWRHGRTEHNLRRIWQGQLDIPLDDVGRGQAATAAQRLLTDLATAREAESGGSAGEPVNWLRIVSSDLSRAADTAQALAKASGVPVICEKRLREVNVGVWQGMTRAEILEAGMGEQLRAWQDGEDIPLGGGERRSEVGLRGAEAVTEHAGAMDGGTLVAVSHGGIINGTIATLLGLGSDRWGILGVLGNARWARLAHGTRGWRLTGYDLGP